MKYVISTIELPPEGTKEVEELLSDELIVLRTERTIVPKYNPFFKKVWGDFDWMRSLFPKDATLRCYATTWDDLKAKGITDHIGMYDMVDGDKVADFYIGMPAKKDKRATTNGFATNFSYLFVHEYCHHLEKSHGGPDRTHEMDKQGRLKELLGEHLNKNKAITEKLTWLGKVAKYIADRIKNPNTLQPLVARKAQYVIDDMDMLGVKVKIAEGFRTMARQSELYAQGRTNPGKIVTNAKAGESFHNYGVAVDFVFTKEGYNATDKQWKALGDVIKKHGFLWGGDWEFVDKPHAELTLGYSIKDFQEGRVDYKKYI